MGQAGNQFTRREIKKTKQEVSVSRATAKKISMDATVAAVISKLDSPFLTEKFFFSVCLKLTFPKILTELPKCQAGCLQTGYASRH